MKFSRRTALSLTLVALFAGPVSAAEVVNIYSYRQPPLIDPLLARFTAETGIETRVVFAENGLVERMVQEGANSPVDLLLTADVGRLVEAADRGVAQPVTSEVINSKVPANLRDENNQWFGLTMRGRVVYASNDRVKQDKFTYEELADPKWKGKICTRPGNHPYNIALIAAMIAHKGEAEAKKWLEGLKANLAIKPAGNDRSQAKSVFAGECDLAVANTYYMGLMMTNEKEPEQKDWAKSARIIFPTFTDGGTQVNISGMLLAKNAPNKDNALKLMEFLASDEAQKLYADGNFEYPANPKVPAAEIVQAWGTFTPDDLHVADLAKFQAQASKLVDEVQYND